MSISALGSGPTPTTPVSLPQENEAAERVRDQESKELTRTSSLKEGTGTKIDINA